MMVVIILGRISEHPRRCPAAGLWSLLVTIVAVPPVLDVVVAAVVQLPRDVSPPLAHLLHKLLNNAALLGRDGIVPQRRFQVLVVPLPTLLR